MARTKIHYPFVVLACLGLFAQTALAVVGFTVTPNAVSNTYVGHITLQISGLTNTETVVVQKFLDLNANGVIDAADLLVQQFNLTDGQAGMVIGGVTNWNVPGDRDAAPGAITAALNFQNGDFVQRVVGNYLYKLSSPAGHFTPLTNQLAVTAFPFPQEITGNVVSNNTSATVPNAIVILFQPTGGDGPGQPVAGVVANSGGSYTARVPPGSYVPLVVSSNYVFDLPATPSLTLVAGGTLTTNLTLTYAAAGIAGKVTDASSPGVGLPGLWVFAFSTNRLVAFTSADTDGGFNLRVTSGAWALDADYAALAIHGYIGWYDSPSFNANSGGTGVTLAYAKATALFYGSVTDDLGNPVPGVHVESEDGDELYYTEGYTDTNGNYVVGALGGLNNPFWDLHVGRDANPVKYLYSQQTTPNTINAAEAKLHNFTAIRAANQITGTLRDNFGNPIPDVGIWANAEINGLFYHVDSVETDANGNYSFNVGNGTWEVGGFLRLPGNYLRPNGQMAVISNNNAVVNFTATLATRQITGSVTDNDDGNAVVGVTVVAQSGGNYNYSEEPTDANGNYMLHVDNGTWTVGIVDDISLPGNYLGLSQETVSIFNSDAVVNLTAIPATQQITGSVTDNRGNPMAGVFMAAYAAVDGVYSSDVRTDANGNYTLYVANSTWTVGAYLAPQGNCLNPAAQSVAISDNDAVVNFTIQCASALTLGIAWSNAIPWLSVSGEIGSDFVLEYGSALPATDNWHSLATNTLTSDPFMIPDTSAVGSSSRFYRAKLVP